MTPRLESVYFADDPREREHWIRLARVLRSSAAQHCPDWRVTIAQLPPGPQLSVAAGLAANTYKLDHWCALVEQAPDGDGLLLIDADTMILRPLDPIWDVPFDLAYTTKPTTRFPFNAGVIFVRVSEPARTFMRAWRDENRRLLRDQAALRIWRRQYGGMNQAALGSVLTTPHAKAITIRQVPCVEWNCEDATWAAFDPAITRIVHVKSTLRRAVLGFAPAQKPLLPLIAQWRACERAALDAMERSA